MTDELVLVRVRTWTSPDEESVVLVSLPRSLHETLMAYADHGELPDDAALRVDILGRSGAIASHERRTAIAASIARELGTTPNIFTWEVVGY